MFRQCYPGAATCASATPTAYEQYGYDAAGNVTYHRDRAGQNFGMYIDNLNRVGSVYSTDTPSTMPQRFYEYDNLNRTKWVHTPTAAPWVTSWGYDALNRPLYEQVWETSTGATSTVSYGYDAAGRRTYMQWPDGFYVNYDWSVANDLMTIRENGNTTWALAAYTYDNLGRRTFTSRNNGANSSYAYDGISRLASLTNDPAGTVQDLTLGFAYNPAGQIISRSVSNNAYVYTPASTAIAYVNNILNQLTSINGSGVGYNSRGEITSVPGATYGYDALGQMTSASAGFGSAGFTYDNLGRLRGSTGSTTRRYLYDGQQVIAEYDGSGVIQGRYVPGLGLNDVVTSYDAGGNRSWLLSDERQSVVALTNGSGAAFVTNTYDEYGVPAASNAGLFQYTGQMWLPDAQLYHYRARAYAPQIGRFMQTDPIGYGAGANIYAYVGGDPVNMIDPLGLETREYRCIVANKSYQESNGDIVVIGIPGWCQADFTISNWFENQGGSAMGLRPFRGTRPARCPSGPYIQISVGGSASKAGQGRGASGGGGIGISFSPRDFFRTVQGFFQGRVGGGRAIGVGRSAGAEIGAGIQGQPLNNGYSMENSGYIEGVTPEGSATVAIGKQGLQGGASTDLRGRLPGTTLGAYAIAGAQTQHTVATDTYCTQGGG